jgi:hypothetical protein
VAALFCRFLNSAVADFAIQGKGSEDVTAAATKDKNPQSVLFGAAGARQTLHHTDALDLRIPTIGAYSREFHHGEDKLQPRNRL